MLKATNKRHSAIYQLKHYYSIESNDNGNSYFLYLNHNDDRKTILFFGTLTHNKKGYTFSYFDFNGDKRETYLTPKYWDFD